MHVARRRKKRLADPPGETAPPGSAGARGDGGTYATRMAALKEKKAARLAARQEKDEQPTDDDSSPTLLAGGAIPSRFAQIASAKKEKRLIAEGTVLPEQFGANSAPAAPLETASARQLLLLVEAMRRHPGNENIETAACACVHSCLMSTKLPAESAKSLHKLCLDECNLLPQVIDLILQKERSPLAMEMACTALWALCHADTAAAEQASIAGTASALKQVLQVFAGEPKVVDAAAQALSCMIVLTRPRKA
eukprot:COSAG05_NODE_1066_length_5973_cov_116.687606_2_plen_251_part_00